MNVSHKRGIREHTWKYCLRFYIQVGTTATVPHAAHRQHSVRLRQQLPCLHSCLLHASEQRAHLVPPQLERRPFLREWQEIPCSGLSESSCSPSKQLHVLPQLFASCVWEGILFTGAKYLWIVRYFFLKLQKKTSSTKKHNFYTPHILLQRVCSPLYFSPFTVVFKHSVLLACAATSNWNQIHFNLTVY